MEQPLRRNQFDLNSPIEGDAGAISNRSDVSRQAGHILLHESPHGGEISLTENAEQISPDPNAQVARTELPAWYNVKFNAIDQVVEQDYGQAFQQEQRAEQVGNDNGATTTMPTAIGSATPQTPSGQNPLQTQAPTAPAAPSVPAYAAPVVPVPQLHTSLTANNPIYNAMSHPLQANQPQPIDGSVQTAMPQSQQPAVLPAAPAAPSPMQPTTETAYPTMPQQPLSAAQPYGPSSNQPQLTGAINPSFTQPLTPMLPPSEQFQEQKLPEGKSARIDAQHLLPAAKKHVSAYARSPWVWLAVGILMILYFARSL